ncbi:uncharacterized protein LOC101459558 [Ceratitis capitata]|uniref:uncharacterized protein LOC101459558 n=1 Tax=Ceratitis capitata TaxID=7213 RepID=UPI00061884DC|nr:uncharacterized protein LOC101459558 [Ceratitis capitata]
MAKRRKSKSKKTGAKHPPKIEKEYIILTPDEQQMRDAKYAMRLADLRSCLSFIDDAFMKVEELKQEEDVILKWKTYLLCDGLPKPYIPPEVRLFFEKLKYFEHLNREKTIDWLLSVDERSILTQDIYTKDMTRRTLVKEIRPNFGDEYKTNIDLLLKVIKSIDYYADDETKIANTTIRILEDILEQKKAAYREIENYLDHYAYRILSAEDSYMESVDATTAEYFYECDNFCIHIWTLKNVPILFQFLEDPCIEAKLHKMQAKIILPYGILKENLTIRGIHFFFDPFSQNAKSYKQDIREVGEDLTAGIPDLHECLVHEHFLQVDLQNQVRTKLIERRAEYENKVHALAEQLEALKKSKSNDEDKKKKEPKLIKLPKEPPIITENSFPDIWEDFLQSEYERFNNFINNIYHPDSLHLELDEINLKKYAILGGIYQFNFVKKPLHYNFNDFNMTWHEDGGQLETIKDIIAEEILPSMSSRVSTRSSQTRFSALSRRSISRLTDAQLSQLFRVPPKNCDSPNFVITIELPEYLCLWGEPLPCHFEDNLIDYTVEEVPTAETNRTPMPAMQSVEERLKSSIRDGLSTASVDFSFTPRQSSSNLSMRPKHSFSNIFRPSMTSLVTAMTTQAQSQASQSMHVPVVDDFMLDMPLTLLQIRNIQRHCLPRIISSFKFPVELHEEATEEQRGKPKGKGGILLRKRLSDDSDETEAVKEFQFEGQNNPERIFPVLAVPEKMHMDYIIQENVTDSITVTGTKHPKSFSDLVQTLDNIRATYQRNYKRTLQVAERKMNVQLFREHRRMLMKIKSADSIVKAPLPVQSSASIQTARYKSLKRKTRVSDMDMLKNKERIRSEILLKDELEKQDELEDFEEGGESKEAEEAPEPEKKFQQKSFSYAHWTTKYIKKVEYEKEERKITIWTDRLGTIGLAYKLYEHFPFKDWRVEPDPEIEGEVLFTLETQYVICVINISANGYRGYVAEPTKGYVRHRKIYMDIKEPITDLKELKKRFHERYLNIFSNHDARFYIENGYFSEKHLACELHTYSCIALHCLMLKFTRSDWNRLGKRRDMVLNFGHARDPLENLIQVRITPENATFVDIKELCSDDLNVFVLEYTLTWRNIDNYNDFHHLIMSAFLSAMDNRCRDPKLLVNVKNLLYEVRPLSYS